MARLLGLTPARISQLKSAGRLEGCYSGENRMCRYDVAKTADRLGKVLDKGQMMGNGAATKAALAKIAAPNPADTASRTGTASGRSSARDSDLLAPEDPDRYELARIQKAEEEARRLRRQNAAEEGIYILAVEVERSVQRLLAQEVAEFESVMRSAARQVADELGVDFKSVRSVLIQTWRTHRGARAEILDAAASVAAMTPDERAEDI